MKRLIKIFCYCVIISIVLSLLPAEYIHAAADKASATKSVTYGSVTYLLDPTWAYPQAYVIDCNESATSVSIPAMVDGFPVVSIEAYAFYQCSNLKHVTLPETLRWIGEHAFGYCSSLTSIEIPASVRTIGMPFAFCTSLQEINVAEDNMTFYSVDGVLYDTMGSGNPALHSYPCGRSGTYTIPNGVNMIRSYCFAGASGLTGVEIPDSVTMIGERIFEGTSLTQIVLPSGITEIPAGTFAHCSALTEISIPDGVTTIAEGAFVGCTSMTDFAFPDGLITIESRAFQNCDALETLCLPAGVTEIENEAFDNMDSLYAISIPESNPYYSTLEGVLFDKELTLLHTCPGGKSGAYEIPDTVQTICTAAFSGCRSLTRVVLPLSLTAIGDYAFVECTSLQRMILPPNLTSLGSSVFYSCTALKSINLPASLQSLVTSYETDADSIFRQCTSLTSISIPDGWNTIPSRMFLQCDSLSSVYIPDSVNLIDVAAFGNCFSLRNVYYGGTEEQWQQITIEIGNNCLESASIHYGKDASDHIGPSITSVRYLWKWDDENRIAYLGLNDVFGCQVSDRTILPENIGELVGQYVLVTTCTSLISVMPPEELLSLYAVETKTGTITAGDPQNKTVEIDGTTYACAEMPAGPWDLVGSEILYHLHSGKLVGFEPLRPETGIVTSWFAEDGIIRFRKGLNSTVDYTISPMARDVLTEKLGPTRFLNTEVEFVADNAQQLYSISWEEPEEEKPILREDWVGDHMRFATGELLDVSVKRGFSGALQDTFSEIRDNGLLYAYRTLDTVNSLLQFDYDFSEQDEYELLLAQILFTEAGVASITQTYNAYFEDAVVEISSIYLEVLKESSLVDAFLVSKFEEAIQSVVSAAKGSHEALSAMNDLMAVLDKMGKITKQNAFLKKLDSPEISFAMNLSTNVIDTYMDTYLNAVMYLAAAKSYCDTADTFGEMLLRLRKHINVPSDDVRFMPYYDRPELLVDDYMIWEQLGIENANKINCPIYLSQLAAAIEEYYLTLEAMKNDDALTVGCRFFCETSDSMCYDITQAGMETVFSLLTNFKVFKIADLIRLFFKGAQFAIDAFTGIDDQAYHGVMVLRLYAMAYIHALTVNDLANSIPNEEYGATEDDLFRWANLFDESVNFYRSILRTAAEYGIAYDEVYCSHLDEAAAEPKEFDYEEVMTEEFVRILNLRNERDGWLSLAWCHALEGDPLKDFEIPKQGVVYTMMCPIDVTVRDASGAVIAQLRDDGSTIQEGYEQYFHVSRSRGEGQDCMKVAAVPRDYTVSVTGTGSGTMHAVVTTYRDGEADETRYYLDVPIESGSAGMFTDLETLTLDGVNYIGQPELHVHSYGVPEFVWSADCTSCAARFVCTECGFIAERAARVQCESTATCTSAGLADFTADVTFDLSDYSTSIRRRVPPIAHSYQSIITEPTCCEAGYTTQTCTTCGKVCITERTEAKGHTLVNNVCTACGAKATEHVQLPGLTWAWTHYADGTLEFTGTGSTYDYGSGFYWDHEPSYASTAVNRVIVRPGITRLGDYSLSSPIYNRSDYELWSRNIRSVELADSVEELGELAFCSCESLQSITIGSGLKTLGELPFLYCRQLSEIRVSPENPYFTAIDNALYSNDGSTLYLYPADAPEQYTLPQGTKEICKGAFANNTATKMLIIPASIERLHSLAFGECQPLKTIIFTGNAPDIDEDTFPELFTTCYYPENAEGWEYIVERDHIFGGDWIAYDPADPPFETGNPFTDIPYGIWFYEPVLWAVENGITNGTSATTFGPNDPCMRAHVVTFLWRAAGEPEPTNCVNPFVDVKTSDFYYKAVLWAVEQGITNGVDATHFGPAVYCNRAQVVTFLHRTLGSLTPTRTENPFTDVPAGQWYTAPVLWAVEQGITNGTSAATFSPDAICNRAQIVTFLYRTIA